MECGREILVDAEIFVRIANMKKWRRSTVDMD
jgi:hypothetical protein